VYFIVQGEIGLHTEKEGVFGKAIQENTLGEECVTNRAKNFSGRFLETTFCLSETACLLFL